MIDRLWSVLFAPASAFSGGDGPDGPHASDGLAGSHASDGPDGSDGPAGPDGSDRPGGPDGPAAGATPTDHGESGLLAPALVIVAYGTVALATVAPVLVAVVELLPGTPTVAVAVGTEAVAVPSLVVAIVGLGVPFLFFVWLFVGGVAYGGARVLGGDGGWRETLAFVGWGFLPKLLGAVALGILVGAYALLDPQVTFAEALVGAREDLQAVPFAVEGPGGPLLPAVVAIEVVASVWTTYVWYGGLVGAQSLPRRRAIALAVLLFAFFNGF